MGYTLGERLGIAVLKELIALGEYFDEQNMPKKMLLNVNYRYRSRTMG